MFQQTMYGIKQMGVARFLVQHTGTYNEQWMRPYVSTGNGEAMHRVSERIATSPGKIGAAAFSGVASEIVRPSAMPETALAIPNGWGTRHFRFMLQIAVQSYLGQQSLQCISGYSEYADSSYGGHIDPKLKFYINSVTELAPVTHRVGNSMQTVHQVKAAAQLVSNHNFQSSLDQTNPHVYSLTPGVVFSTMDADRHNLYRGDNFGSFSDTRMHLTGQPELVNRGYNNSQSYCATITNEWKKAVGLGDPTRTSGDMSMSDVLQDCSVAFDRERDAASNQFLGWLRERRRQSYAVFQEGGDYFTLEDLMALDPNVYNVLQVAPEMPGMHNVGSSCDWSGSDLITQSAAILAQSVPSYMSRFGVQTLALSSSNKYGVVRAPMTVFTGANCFNQEIDNSTTLEMLKATLDAELFQSLSYSGELPYDLKLTVDMYGETWIELQLGTESTSYVYVAPTFADAIFVPQLTLSQANVLGLASDFNNLFDNATDAHHGGFGSVMTNGIQI